MSTAPELAQESGSHRYNAACAASLAAGGREERDVGSAPFDKTRLRALALGWLRAELKAWNELRAGDPAALSSVRSQLQHWLDDDALSTLRDAHELARLPDSERELWTTFWNDVRDLMVRVGAK